MIRRNSDLVTKVVFPLELLPLSQVTASLLQNSFGFAALLFILVVFEHRLHPTIFLLPLIMVPQLVFTCGLSYLISVLGTYVPDIRETLRAFVRAMFFMTPIIWPAGRVPEDYKWLVDYNPLTFLVEAYRNLILEGTLPFGEQAIYFCVVAVVLFVAGLALFNRVKHNFADLV
jgi:ABC-type polysaccharide/polyol phosphate export permease